jgi:hypothetical protein
MTAARRPDDAAAPKLVAIPIAHGSASFDATLIATNPNSKLAVTYFSPLASVSLTPSSPLDITSLPHRPPPLLVP